MWWAGSLPIHVYLGQGEARVAIPGRADVWTQVKAVSQAWDWAVESIRSETAFRRRPVHVWLSGSLARPFMLPELPGVRSSAEARKIAESLAPEEAGLGGACVVHLDRWRSQGATLATAVALDVWEMLVASRESIGPPQSVSPWWCAAASQALAQGLRFELLAVREADAITVLGGKGETLDVAGSFASMDRAEAMKLLSRVALSAALEGQSGMVASLAIAPAREIANLIELPSVPFGAMAELCA